MKKPPGRSVEVDNTTRLMFVGSVFLYFTLFKILYFVFNQNDHYLIESQHKRNIYAQVFFGADIDSDQ